MIDEKLIRQVTVQQDNNKIYKADLSAKNIQKISGLKAYQKIRCLLLNFNYISVIENISILNDLRQLHLQGNQIAKIEGLQNNKSLTLLNLSSNQIEKIENISHLVKLKTLLLNKNRINKLAGLQYLKQLQNLQVAYNQLVSVQSMPSFSKLQSLDLSHNFIGKISKTIFGQNNKLFNLNLSYNELENVGFLVSLPNLQQLDLSHNQIQNFEPEIILSVLQNLNLQSNSITQLPQFSSITPDLITLNISSNYVSSEMQLIQSIANSTMLSQIDFRDNPMYSDNFEETMLKLYKFDFINNKAVNKPGTKYYTQVDKIQKQFADNPLIYLEDDEVDRKYKLSGFYNQDLETAMTGMKPNRPPSPTAKITKKVLNNEIFEKVDQVFKEFTINNERINQLRNQYLVIFEQNNIQPDYAQIEKSRLSYTSNMSNSRKQISSIRQRQTQDQSVILTQPKKQQYETCDFKRFKSVQKDLRKQNQANMNQWNQVKNKQKSFNIRDVMRKKSGRQSLGNSQTKINSRTQLLKTQEFGGKWNNTKILQTINRPRPASLRKKQSSNF